MRYVLALGMAMIFAAAGGALLAWVDTQAFERGVEAATVAPSEIDMVVCHTTRLYEELARIK